ncbi:MAG: IS200/IS605 family transposase [Isosphaeraceae bacterium]
MPQSLVAFYAHLIFSTRGRAPLITAELQPRLYEYIGGILRNQGCSLVAAGGMPDHVHFLVSMDKGVSVVELMRVVKTNSSRWVHDEFPGLKGFAWQAGYGAFSVSASHVERVRAYLSRQAEHHRARTFQEEFVAFLQRYGIAYDERYLWD